jgi:nicotinate-nucleotide adenylyltransferase
MAATRKLILFGGTFDPPHLGHVNCVEAVARQFPDQQIWILPAKVSPGIGNGAKESTVPWSYRFEMCQLTFGDVDPTRMTISDIESKLPTPNYTIQTIERLAAIQPGVEISLILGWDQFQYFHKWYRPFDILTRASLIVISRSEGWNPHEAMLRASEEIGFRFRWNDAQTVASIEDGKQVIFISAQTADVSSTQIRNLVKDDRLDLIQDRWLEPRTREYIVANKLYRRRITP